MRDPKDYCHIKTKFPPPEEGEKCCKFLLDLLDGGMEEERMLELVPGRMQLVDGVNHHFIVGAVEERSLNDKNSSPYYKVTLGRTEGSRWEVPPDVKPHVEFVALGRRKLIKYNSKVPVVVYMPEDAKLHYRIWRGGEECIATEQ